MKSATTSVVRRISAIILSFSMVLALFGNFAAPQIAAAATTGIPSAAGTIVDTYVRSPDIDRYTKGDYYCLSDDTGWRPGDTTGIPCLSSWTDPNFDGSHGPALEVNHITGQDTTTRVSVRLNILWKEATPATGYTITFTIPYGADYFQLGTDTQTNTYVKPVASGGSTVMARGTNAATQALPGQPRTVTLALQGTPGYNQMFTILYSFGYFPYAFNFDGDTGDLTPHLNDPTKTQIAQGTQLLVTTAAEADMYAGLQYPTTRDMISQTDDNFATKINTPTTSYGYTSPRTNQLAKIGVYYTFNPVIQAELPDSYTCNTSGYGSPVDTTRRNPQSNGYINGATLKTATMTIMLPAEAVLAPDSEQSPYFLANYTKIYDPTDPTKVIGLQQHSWGNGAGVFNDAAVSVNNGDTGNVASDELQMTDYYSTGYRPRGTNFKVSYNAEPANGTSYVYDVQVAGTWYDNSPVNFGSAVDHLYTPDPITANYILSSKLTATYLPGIPQGNFYTHRASVNDGYVMYSTNHLESLTPGDWASFSYEVSNAYAGVNPSNPGAANYVPPSEAPIDNISIHMPVDGNLWDFQDMWISKVPNISNGILTNPLIKDFFDTLTITYSDGTSRTVSFSDDRYFDQTATINGPNSDINAAYPAKDFSSWVMNGKSDTIYITSFDITLKQTLQYMDSFTYGFKAQLRTVKHDGSPVVTQAVADPTQPSQPLNPSQPYPAADYASLTATATGTPEVAGATALGKNSVYTFTPVGHGTDGSGAVGSATYATKVPIYPTQDSRPLGDHYTQLNRQGPAGTYNPGGATIAMVDLMKPNPAGVSFNAFIVNPSANIVVPSNLTLDLNSVKVYIGRGLNDLGTAAVTNNNYRQGVTSAGGVDFNSDYSYRQLSAADFTAEVVPNSLANAAGYTVYKITYTGAASPTDANTGILKDLDDWCMRVDYNLVIPEDAPVQNGLTVRVFWTEGAGFTNLRGWGNAMTDVYDLDGDGATTGDTLQGAISTFDIVIPPALQAKYDAQGDTGVPSWLMDGNTIGTVSDANLARVRTEGDIRATVQNGLSTDAAGDLYFKLPVGDFTPTLTGLTLTSYNYNTATSTNIPLSSLTLSYSTQDSAINDPRGLAYTAVSDVSGIPSDGSAVWVKISGISVPGYTELRLTESYDIPADTQFGDAVRGVAYADVSSLSAGHYYSATNYGGLFVSKPAYVINYYKGAIDAAHLLGSAVYGDPPSNTTSSPDYVQTGDKVTVATGTTQGQLDWKQPAAGYYDGVQQGTTPYTVAEGLEYKVTINGITYPANVINVLYEAKVYTVVYDTAGGTPAIPTKTDVSWEDTDVVVPPPTRPGYTFTGWKVTDGGTGQMAAAGDAYSDLALDDNTMSVTLTAQWTKTVYAAKVVYHLDSATGSVIATETITPVYYLDLIDSTGYLNLHRPLGYNSGVAVEPSWSIADDATANVFNVYYTARDYTVNYNTAGGTPATIDPMTGVNWNDDGLLPATEPTKTGFTFDGWLLTSGGSQKLVTDADAYKGLAFDENTSAITLTAQWKPIDYTATILYHLDTASGSVIATETIDGLHYQDLIAKTGYLDLHRPLGYTAGVAAEPTWVVSADPAANVFNVYYVPRVYEVDYNTAGGTPAVIDPLTDVNWNDDGLLPAEPSKTGFDFAGWKVTYGGPSKMVTDSETYGGLAYDENTPAITLTAQWTPIVYTATVLYHLDTPDGSVVATETITDLYYQDIVSQAGYLDLHRPLGYTAGVAVEPSWVVSAQPAENVFNVFYTAKPYTVNYVMDGGSPAADPLTDVNFNDDSLLPAEPSKPGFTFSGWKVTAGGAEKMATDSDTYGMLAFDENTEAITLTAQWTPIDYKVTVIYHLDTPDGKIIGTEYIEPKHYQDVIDPAGYLDLHRPTGYQSGVAVEPDWVVSYDEAANVFNVYYINIAPVITVERPVLYIEEGNPLSLDEILRLAGVGVSDTEDSMQLSDLEVGGLSGVKWSVIDYPDGTGYVITLDVMDSGGKVAEQKTITIFVEKNDPQQKPVDPSELPEGWPKAPEGMAWGKDPSGNLELFVVDPAPKPQPKPQPKPKPLTPIVPKAGDTATSFLLIELLAGLGIAGTFVVSRRRYTDQA